MHHNSPYTNFFRLLCIIFYYQNPISFLFKKKFSCYGKCFVLKIPGFRLGGSGGGSLSLHTRKTKI